LKIKTLKLIPFGQDLDLEISTSISQQGPLLNLTYTIKGDIDNISGIDNFVSQSCDNNFRRIGLWEDTCFELFLYTEQPKLHYLEFNFSSQGQWNCFEFFKIREELKEYLELKSFVAESIKNNKEFIFNASIDTDYFPIDLKEVAQLKFGISCVIKIDGGNTLWAVKHGEKPDFHDPANFIIL
jgi:hypothetical protein